MENIIYERNFEGNNNGDKVIVKASEILKKLKSPQDRHNFAMENSKSIFY
jgi:hypothetical protein